MRFASIALFCLFACSTGFAQADQMQALVQSIDVPAGERLVLRAEASGYQIYHCTAYGSSAEWTFVAPEAKLSIGGAEIGLHRAGLSWVHRDGSAVFGEALAKAPSLDADSIPMLLLKAARTEGTGTFSVVNYIQRKIPAAASRLRKAAPPAIWVPRRGFHTPLCICSIGWKQSKSPAPRTREEQVCGSFDSPTSRGSAASPPDAGL